MDVEREKKRTEMIEKMAEKEMLREDCEINVKIINDSAESEESKKLVKEAYDLHVKGQIERNPQLGADLEALKSLYSTALDLVKANQELAEKNLATGTTDVKPQANQHQRSPMKQQSTTRTEGSDNGVTEEELIALHGETKIKNLAYLLKMANKE